MKILIISHMYPSSCNPMAGIFVHKQALALKKAGCDIKVVSPVPFAPFPLNVISRKWKEYAKVPKHTVMDGIDVYYPRYLEFPRGFLFHRSGFFMALGIKSTVKKIYESFKFNIIHANVALPDGYAAMITARDYPVKKLITIHGQDFQNTINKNESCRKALDKALESSDGIITVSSKLRNIVKDKSYYNKISVVYNGIDIQAVEAEKSVRADRINIISVSNLKKTKGIEYNIKALASLVKRYDNLHYYIIGAGEEEANLKGLAESLNITRSISFLGKKQHQEVLKWVAACDIFSLPSYREGFGIAYIEAMSLGIPVIGVKGEGIADIIINKENGLLVERQDINSLKEALSFLIENREKGIEIGEKAKALVLNHFTWKENAEHIVNIYNNLNR